VILAERPISRSALTGGCEPLRAAVTAVYAKADGSVVPLGRPLRMGEAMVKGYRTRYDVGMAKHEHEFDIANELPSREDVFRFYARVQFGFQVHDPAQVVLARVQDGFQLARWRLLEAMRDISRKYMTEDCAKANEEINKKLGSRPQVYDEGITVYRFAAFLSLDAQTQDALRKRRATDHEILQARKLAELELVKARLQGELENERMVAVRQAMRGDQGLLALHMARHPDDTAKVVELVMGSHDSNHAARIDLLKSMMENNLIQNIDLQEIRDENLRQILRAVQADSLQSLQVSSDPAPQALPSQPAAAIESSIPLPPPTTPLRATPLPADQGETDMD
jgi:hypothetical protein